MKKKFKMKLHKVYADKEEFLAYDIVYGIAKRLGYKDPEKLWKDNPTVEGSTDPKDFRISK